MTPRGPPRSSFLLLAKVSQQIHIPDAFIGHPSWISRLVKEEVDIKFGKGGGSQVATFELRSFVSQLVMS